MDGRPDSTSSGSGRRVVLGTIEPGQMTFGHWCARCALPSLVECEVLLITPSGVSMMGTVRVCSEHGEEWDET